MCAWVFPCYLQRWSLSTQEKDENGVEKVLQLKSVR